VTFRLTDEVQRCVLFFGLEGSRGTPVWGGTGFVLDYEGCPHIVTCAHVARNLEHVPFYIGTNDHAGNAHNMRAEISGWFFHPDEGADLALVPTGIPTTADVAKLPTRHCATRRMLDQQGIGPGCEVHAVGLFRLLTGKSRNLRVVHTGSISMMPDGETIPSSTGFGRVMQISGYLVEAQTLEGLSGAPVFARRNWAISGKNDEQRAYVVGDPVLMGIWQGSWEAPPGEVLGKERPGASRFSYGMGIVIPTDRILELMQMSEVVERRRKVMEQIEPKHNPA
jgi:hypothetical protein